MNNIDPKLMTGPELERALGDIHELLALNGKRMLSQYDGTAAPGHERLQLEQPIVDVLDDALTKLGVEKNLRYNALAGDALALHERREDLQRQEFGVRAALVENQKAINEAEDGRVAKLFILKEAFPERIRLLGVLNYIHNSLDRLGPGAEAPR